MYIPKLSMVYLYVWGFATLLYSMNMITMLSGITFTFLFIVLILPLSLIFFSEILLGNLSNNKGKYIHDISLLKRVVESKESLVTFFFGLWSVLSLADVLVSGFLPILSVGPGSDLSYTDYGVRGLGGINNSIAITLAFCLSCQWFFKIAKRKSIWSFIIICFWQIVTLRRGILFSILFIFLLLYIVFNFHKLKSLIVKSVFAGFALIYGFGTLGDARGTINPFAPMVRDSYKDLFDFLPTGFLWIYVYITSSLQNLADNINLLWGDCHDVFFPLLSLAPSLIRREGVCDFKLQIDYLNVGSYLALYVITGNTWAFFIYLAMPIVFTVICRTMFMRTKNLGYLGAFIILMLCWLLSPFTNLFFLPTYVLSPIMLICFFSIKFK